MSWWPFRAPPVFETKCRLNFSPFPDITPYEVSKILGIWGYVNEALPISKEDLAACIPEGCGRHFSLSELCFERRGSEYKLLRVNQVFLAAPEPRWIFPKPVREPDDPHRAGTLSI